MPKNGFYVKHLLSCSGEGEVTVDESLFQDLEDLDLDDEDDEDYVPGMDEGVSD